MAKMKAVLFYAPGDIRYEEIEVPKPGRGEVLIKVGAALTCGTDVKTYRRGHPLLIPETPAVFGHEFAGTIAALGAEVEGFSLGQRVVAANSAPCNGCFYCKIGRPNLCENLELLNGAYAEYIVVPEGIVRQNLLPIPDHVTFRQAALVEPLACVLHGVERSGIRLGEKVAIIGVGPIGLLFVSLAKLKGARIIAIDKNDFRLRKARELGADETIDVTAVPDVASSLPLASCLPVSAQRTKAQGGETTCNHMRTKNLEAGRGCEPSPHRHTESLVVRRGEGSQGESSQVVMAVRDLTPGGRGVDVAIEAVGLPQTWEQAIAMVRPGGTITLFGGCPSGTSIRIDTRRLHYDELKIVGVFHHTPRYVARALELIALGKIDPDRLITHEMGLPRLEEALQLVMSGQALKVAIIPHYGNSFRKI